MTDLSLVVMAAGIGSRYGGLKQIEPVGPNGEALLEYSIYDAILVGFQRAIFVIRPEIQEVFRQRIGSRLEGRITTIYVHQDLNQLPPGFEVPRDRLKPWGTGQAVLAAGNHLDGPFAVINGDDFYGRRSFALLINFLKYQTTDSRDLALIGYPVEHTLSSYGPVSRGICRLDGEGFIEEIVEQPKVQSFDGQVRYSLDGQEWHDVPSGSLASMNLWGFPPSFLEELRQRFSRFLSRMAQPDRDEYYLPAVVDEIIKEGRARGRVLPTPDRWFGITYPQDRDRVAGAIRDLISRGLYPESLWAS